MHLICGEALYDVFVERHESGSGSEVSLTAIAGGSPFNVAIGMARLGSLVSLVSDVATDFLGDRLVAQLSAEGVGLSFLRRTAGACALAIISTDTPGKPSYSFSGLEQARYFPMSDALDEAEDAISGIHLGSIAMVLPKSSAALVAFASRFSSRALISLDPNIRLSIVPDRATWHEAIESLRPFCHVIKVSEEDIEQLYGDADPYSICRGWLTGRTALVVLTRGATGAAILSRSAGRVDIPPIDTVVVDSVGAGDSFMAALLFALTERNWMSCEAIASLEAEQLFALGHLAASAASITCSRRGPNLPTASELQASRDASWFEN